MFWCRSFWYLMSLFCSIERVCMIVTDIEIRKVYVITQNLGFLMTYLPSYFTTYLRAHGFVVINFYNKTYPKKNLLKKVIYPSIWIFFLNFFFDEFVFRRRWGDDHQPFKINKKTSYFIKNCSNSCMSYQISICSHKLSVRIGTHASVE